MLKWLQELDGVLRGHKTDPHLLTTGKAAIQIKSLATLAIALGMIYGVFMGLYAVLTRTPPCVPQMIASAVKVPALFFLTLVVTFPSLYVFSALMGVRLGPKDTLRLIMVPITVNLAVLASLGPITGFFTLSTTSYHFMKLLNFVFFAVSGLIGLKVLLTMLARLEAAQAQPDEVAPIEKDAPKSEDAADQTSPSTPPKPTAPRKDMAAQRTFQVWLVIYALVGAQMGWILRPFIGAPNLPFEWFRDREANIFVDVLRTIGELFGV